MLSKREQRLAKKQAHREKHERLREDRRKREGIRQAEKPDNGNGGLVASATLTPNIVSSPAPVVVTKTVLAAKEISPPPVLNEPHWMETVILANPNNVEIGQVVYVDPERVRQDPKQPRKQFDPGTIAELARSIRDDGQEEPAQVYRAEGIPGIDWILKNGERRWRACRLGKLPLQVLIKRKPISDLRLKIEQTLSNGNREDLCVLDDAENIQELLDLGCSMEKVCETYNKSQPWIYQRLALLKLDPAVKALMSLSVPEDQRLGPAVAYEISSAPRSMQYGLAQEVKGMKITHARRAIRAKLGKDRDQLDANRNRKPSDDRRVLDAFLTRTADDAATFADFGPHVFSRMFAFMQPSDLELAKQRCIRAVNNLAQIQGLLDGIKPSDTAKTQ